MAYFRVTNIWYERIDGHAGLKVRFEKVSLGEKSWWAAIDTPDPLPYHRRPFVRPEVGHCIYCDNESPRVFQQGWMCLQKDCTHFWKIGNSDPPANLIYHPSWLDNRCDPQTTAIAPHEPLIPTTLAAMAASNDIDATSRDTWRGIVCPQCKKCIQRVLWHGWKCNIDFPVDRIPERCTFEQIMQLRPVSIREVAGPRGLLSIEMDDTDDENDMDGMADMAIGREVDLLSLLPYRKHTYFVPGIGSVTHFLANAGINERPGGPDDIFDMLQKEPLGLRRFPLDTAVGKLQFQSNIVESELTLYV